MGNARRKPKRLAQKLLAVRQRLEVSQTEMARLLDLKQTYTVVSSYESGRRQPDLIVLLLYARLARVPVETLVDDKLDLPGR
jgi:transcriptional regulator with XRE-family HTH domain